MTKTCPLPCVYTVILLMVLFVSAATLTGGIIRYMEEGMTDNALILILFGSIVFLFVALAFVITLCTEPLPQRPPRLPYPDSPPKYRETWRRQHLESLSQATDTYTGETSHETGGTTVTNLSRLDVRSLWRSTAIPGVHETPKRTTSVSGVSGNQGELGISSSRSGRANTDPHIWISDEGLPSYEEALSR